MTFESRADGALTSRRATRRRLTVAAVVTTGAVLVTGAIAQAGAYSFGAAAPRAASQKATAGMGSSSSGGSSSMAMDSSSGSSSMGSSSMSSSSGTNWSNYRMGNTYGAGWSNLWQRQHPFIFHIINNPLNTTFNQILGISDTNRAVGYYGSGASAMSPNQGFSVGAPFGTGSFSSWNYPGSVQTQVVAINGLGYTAGFYVDRHGANYGFVNWNGRWMSVSYPSTWKGMRYTQILGLNNSGMAVGFYNDRFGVSHGFTFNVFTHRFVVIVLPFQRTAIVVTGINNRGDLSGFFVQRKTTRAFLIIRHRVFVISLGNGRNTQALGLNNRDQLVGSFTDFRGRTHGFVFWHGTFQQVDVPRSVATVVNGINNRGVIVGFFVDRRGFTNGFIAIRRNTGMTMPWTMMGTGMGTTTGTTTPMTPTTGNMGTATASGHHW